VYSTLFSLGDDSGDPVSFVPVATPMIRPLVNAMMGDDPAYNIDFRAQPAAYEIGRGEEGVFKVQPYKDELLPHWGFADRETADGAGSAIYDRFLTYRERGEFVGMDMARKYLQMGYTRAMRYARYPGGQKYEDSTERDPEFWVDHDKREAALVFEVWHERVEADDTYRESKAAHRERHTEA
jgi:hypothetical protein